MQPSLGGNCVSRTAPRGHSCFGCFLDLQFGNDASGAASLDFVVQFADRPFAVVRANLEFAGFEPTTPTYWESARQISQPCDGSRCSRTPLHNSPASAAPTRA